MAELSLLKASSTIMSDSNKNLSIVFFLNESAKSGLVDDAGYIFPLVQSIQMDSVYAHCTILIKEHLAWSQKTYHLQRNLVLNGKQRIFD